MANNLDESTTRLRVYIDKKFVSLGNVDLVEISGNSIPTQIYRDVPNNGFYDSIALESRWNGEVVQIDEPDKDINKVMLEFECYGTDSQSIHIQGRTLVNPVLAEDYEEEQELYHTVRFIADWGIHQDGSKILVKKYAHGERLGTLPTVDFEWSREKFANEVGFDGWFTTSNSTSGDQASEDVVVLRDLDYYSNWTRYLYYEFIGEDVVEEMDGSAGYTIGDLHGFSTTSYLRLVSYLDLNVLSFDFVVNATTGEDTMENEQEVIGCDAYGKDIEAGVWHDNFSWEFNHLNDFDCGDAAIIPELDTEYYMRLLKNEDTTRCYAREPDGNWVCDFTIENSKVNFPVTRFVFGNDGDAGYQDQWWHGIINLRYKSYIILEGIKYRFKPVPDDWTWDKPPSLVH